MAVEAYSPSSVVAGFVANTNLATIPPAAISAAKEHLVDTIGCIISASQQPSVQQFRSLLTNWGSASADAVESTVHGERVPLVQAAAIDAFAGRLWDFDNTHDATGDHPSVASVPAALAVAQRVGASGSELLGAIAIGEEVQLRVRLGSAERLGTSTGTHPWTTGTYAPFGAMATAARLFHLDDEATADAVGHAFAECSNTVQSQHEGAESHRVHQGFATASGLLATLAARSGFRGMRRPLEGSYGYYRSFHNAIGPSDSLLAGLGSTFHMTTVSAKPYPCCRMIHAPLRALQRLMNDSGLEAADIRSIRLQVGRAAQELCVPPQRRPPSTVAEAQFNLPYVIALGCVSPLSIATLTDISGSATPEALRLLDAVDVELSQELRGHSDQITDARVTVHTWDGRAVEGSGASHSASRAELGRKFVSNCVFGGIDPGKAEGLLRQLQQIDAESNAGLAIVGWLRAARN